ncbi:hypothetical protein N1851_004568 [Merluccius polli]|uniref:Uncharacterized protein n=1 Tax=Merluccius polli TaxID=89951 RepID=A0AA47N7E8_MERPO|nr:hypothetical protein N1851_004568 [Merluccius polli]
MFSERNLWNCLDRSRWSSWILSQEPVHTHPHGSGHVKGQESRSAHTTTGRIKPSLCHDTNRSLSSGELDVGEGGAMKTLAVVVLLLCLTVPGHCDCRGDCLSCRHLLDNEHPV